MSRCAEVRLSSKRLHHLNPNGKWVGAPQTYVILLAVACGAERTRKELGAPVTSMAPGWDEPHHPTPCDSWCAYKIT